MHYFPDVTLLITHYNRSSSLARLLKAFQEQNCRFGDIVVSDDCSKPEHLQALGQLQHTYPFQLVSTPENKGLGNNINKGQQAVKTPYTLYVQEDFVPTALFASRFEKALALMQQESSLDLVRFYAYGAYPYLQPYKEGFMEIRYKPWFIRTDKIYCYSDHPHLRRSSFPEKFGRYTEGIKSDKTEYLMCLSFIQNKGRGLFYPGFQDLFTQENTAEEPSTVSRSQWRQSKSPLVSCLRFTYRVIKYNYDLHLSPLI
jgi:glycosyltransferase involved in cell wall biosynthesis